MSNNRHLTGDQLSALSGVPFSEIEPGTARRHLMMCDECRRQLPLPGVDRLWSAVLMQNELDEDVRHEKPETIWSQVPAGLSSVWRMRSNWAFGGAALIVLIVFSFLIRGWAEKTPDEIVRVIGSQPAPDLKFPAPIQTSDKEARVSPANSNQSAIAPNPGPAKTNPPKPKAVADASPNFLPKKTIENRVIISQTRGKASKCSEQQQLLEMESFSEKENYVFKWKKMPKAAKYHIYISDDDEVLVDEYETTKETTFVLKKPLDPAKTYKWKIIVTLESGRTIVGDAQKFNFNKFQNNLKKFNRKESLAVRCTANE